MPKKWKWIDERKEGKEIDNGRKEGENGKYYDAWCWLDNVYDILG